MTPPRTIGYRYLGAVPYNAALRMQQTLVQRRLAARQSHQVDDQQQIYNHNVLLLLQHPPTYTTGIRRFTHRTTSEQDADNDAEQRRLEQLGAAYVKTRRGGEITYHGPGQLVGYPLLDLQQYRLGVRCYVAALERALIATCAHYGLETHTSSDTGVWLGNDKIAALGIDVRRYLTSHGFALNCTTDLGWFDHIIPCGLRSRGVTSLAKVLAISGQADAAVTPEAVFPVYIEAMAREFQCKILPLEAICPELSQQIDLLATDTAV